MAVVLAAVALVKGLFWIALIPIFKIADEPTHFENIQFRGEHFAAPYSYDNEPYGNTIHAGSPPDVKLAWARTNELFRNRYLEGLRSIHEEFELRQMAADPESRRGTGRLTSASYPGFYYNSAVPVYEVFKRTSLLTRVAAVRCVSLFYGILAIIATYFAARLVMKSQALAIAAAMVVMLQPMESQMTAAVNNDAGVIGLAAVLFYLQLRFLVRAPEIPSFRWGALMGIVAACIAFTKPQGYAMLPGCGFVCAWVVATNLRDRRAWLFAAITAACAAILLVASLMYLQRTGQTALISGPSTTASAAARPPSPSFWKFLTSLDEPYKYFLFRSFFGQFGWLEYSIPPRWLDHVSFVWRIVQVGTVAAIAAAALRISGWRWLSMKGFLFSIYTSLFTVAFILFAEHRFRLMGTMGVIQGRNMLLGLPALALVAAAGFGALVPARFRTLSAAALTMSAAGFHAGAVLYIFRYHYGT